MPRPPLALEIRFWQQVAKGSDDECWLWTGSKDKDGYGKIKTYDRKTIRPHRLSWEIHKGPIPDGMRVCHDCPGADNPSCVNPAHLWLGSDKDNIRDSFKKGQRKILRGEECSSAKLTAAIVNEIRLLYASGEQTQAELARSYGLGHVQISRIVRGKQWKHIPILISKREKHGSKKLTEDKVKAIRDYCACKVNGIQRRAAKEFGVSVMLISLIVRRKLWKQV